MLHAVLRKIFANKRKSFNFLEPNSYVCSRAGFVRDRYKAITNEGVSNKILFSFLTSP